MLCFILTLSIFFSAKKTGRGRYCIVSLLVVIIVTFWSTLTFPFLAIFSGDSQCERKERSLLSTENNVAIEIAHSNDVDDDERTENRNSTCTWSAARRISSESCILLCTLVFFSLQFWRKLSCHMRNNEWCQSGWPFVCREKISSTREESKNLSNSENSIRVTIPCQFMELEMIAPSTHRASTSIHVRVSTFRCSVPLLSYISSVTGSEAAAKFITSICSGVIFITAEKMRKKKK